MDGHEPYEDISGEQEYFFMCPYCWQEISFLIDLSVGSQSYVEDCEVCCNPINITYEVENGQVIFFDAQPLE